MDIVGKRRLFFRISGVVMLLSIVSLLIPPALNLGIEFTGGSTISVEFGVQVPEAQLRDALVDLGHPEAVVQPAGENKFFIRISRLREADALLGITSESEVIKQRFDSINLSEDVAAVTIFDVSSVSGVIAKDTVRNAIIALIVASIAITFFITWAFRQVPNPFRYGVSAIIALVHDVLVVLGIFSILGKTLNLEVNAMFITGVLTVIGYSVNDTIVVFDRIRENVARMPGERLEKVVNTSLLETIGRSLNTSITLLVTIAALIFLGGESIRSFLYVLLIGLVTGTYSSIFIASQLLVSWETGEVARLLRRFRLLPSRPQA